MEQIYAGHRVLSRVIDGIFLAGIQLFFPGGAEEKQMVLTLLYILYYGTASLFDGITLGRFYASTELKTTTGGRPKFWAIFLRDMFFLTLFPLIFVQWVFGCRYAHDRITRISPTRPMKASEI